ncbi:MAG: hypothetical protein HYX93_03050 [Chloroflexi bacterium]|nr:hypothetical protein [Chloroflexota bacterium]
MKRAQINLRLLATFALVSMLLGVLACSRSEPTEPPKVLNEWTDHTTQTESYRINVRTGPRVTLEVMQAGGSMTEVDRGRPVNHHLEVHIFDKTSGAEVKTLIPEVGITSIATGEFTAFAPTAEADGDIPYVTACLLANHRLKEPHFGDNLYLANGTYTVTVTVGSEVADTEIAL